ncbi:carbohydrate binding domain-containing protein [Krasilnikovia sp. MM14-A1259]|uniref:carbohydrate binding domain-containing protein n=1 Tax=Krasilnikovia sp. MM14-A1259 TaxID=3373539 RepID=UPI003802E8EF
MFPQTVLPVRVRIAPGGQPDADPSTWVWVDITQWVRVESAITIEEGRSDEGARVDASKCSMTLDNRDGRFSTRNILGDWYGRLGKGTPLRVGTIAIADTFTRTVASSWGSTDTGQTWQVSGSPSPWSVNGSSAQLSFTTDNFAEAAQVLGASLLDVDAQFTASVPAVMTGAAFVAALQLRYVDVDNFYWVSCEFNVGGTITAKIRKTIGGSTTELAVLAPVPSLTYIAGQAMRVRAQADGPALRVKVWADGGTEPDSWTLTASDTTLPSAGLVGFYLWNVIGNASAPFSVTVDDLEVEAVEYTGAVYDWPPRWDKSRRDATTPITASGILRRLQQRKGPLRSPITRMMLRNNPIAYWPGEDDSSATVVAAATAATAAASARAAEFAQETPQLLGAKQTIGVTASTVLTGRIPDHTATGTWGVTFFAQLLAPPAATTRIMTITTTGTFRTVAVELNAVGVAIRGYDATGALVLDEGGLYATDTPPTWVAYDVLLQQSGGTIDITLITYGVIGDTTTPTMYFVSGTYAGTIGSPTGWRAEGSLGFNGGRIAHIGVFNYEPPFVTYAFANAANGYLSELAADRIARLCAEEAVQVVVEAGTSEPMGPQRTDTFLGLLYSCEDADLGILYERGSGLAYRPRGARYNRAAELVLDFDAGDVAEPPEPTDDDQRLKNQWTVSRDGGSSAVAQDDASIAAAGLIDDSATINVAGDDVLDGHASWRLAMSTVDEYRWPAIALNLARNTAQIAAWRACSPFPRVTIANEPSQVAGNAVDLTVLGHVQTLGAYDWDIQLNCAPTAPWNVGVYDSTTRYDSASTTLGADAAAGTSPLQFSTADLGDVWTITSAPFDVLCAGERPTVTWMSSVGSIMDVPGGFEDSLTGWSVTGATSTAARSTLYAHTGVASAQLTVAGSPAVANLFNTNQFTGVAVGDSYTAQMWVYATAPVNNVRIAISWYTSGGVFISTTGGTAATVAAGTWTEFILTMTAPATAAKARVVAQITTSPPNGTVLYVDDMDLIADASSIAGSPPYVQNAFVTRPALTKDLAAGEPIHVATPARYAL